MPFSKLMQFASSGDKCYYYIGMIFACATGAVLPSFVFLFGDLIDGFNPARGQEGILTEIKKISLIFTLLGVGVFVASYLYYAMMLIFAERNGLKFRIKYLNAILNQDT